MGGNGGEIAPLLKTFIHEAYTRRLTSIQMSNTAGGQGDVQQNIYNILDINGAEDTNDDTIATVPGADRATTPGSDTDGRTYAATNASTITAEVTTAINQLAANQTHILQQMAAMSIAAPSPPGHCGAGVQHPARRQHGNPHRGVSAGR